MPTTPLSTREKEVTGLLLQGHSNKQIAAALTISERTVEFHLKNIYAKRQVNSRVELILKLGKTAGAKPVESTGAESAQKSDNGIRRKRPIPLSEFNMKTFLKATFVSLIAALLAAFIWRNILIDRGESQMLQSFAIAIWLVPLGIGCAVGWLGQRTGSSLLRIFLSTLAGTGLGPLTVIPLMVAAVLPVGLLAQQFGFINAATMPSDVATQLAALSMSVLWLVAGLLIGTIFLFVSLRKPAPTNVQQSIAS